MHAFNQSLKYDQRMHPADIKGSIAYAKSLALVGILSKEEERRMIEGLQAVGKEWEDGTVCFFEHDMSDHGRFIFLSLKSKKTTRISIPPMSVVSASSSDPWGENFTLVVPEMIKLPLTCVSGF